MLDSIRCATHRPKGKPLLDLMKNRLPVLEGAHAAEDLREHLRCLGAVLAYPVCPVGVGAHGEDLTAHFSVQIQNRAPVGDGPAVIGVDLYALSAEVSKLWTFSCFEKHFKLYRQLANVSEKDVKGLLFRK